MHMVLVGKISQPQKPDTVHISAYKSAYDAFQYANPFWVLCQRKLHNEVSIITIIITIIISVGFGQLLTIYCENEFLLGTVVCIMRVLTKSFKFQSRITNKLKF